MSFQVVVVFRRAVVVSVQAGAINVTGEKSPVESYGGVESAVVVGVNFDFVQVVGEKPMPGA